MNLVNVAFTWFYNSQTNEDRGPRVRFMRKLYSSFWTRLEKRSENSGNNSRLGSGEAPAEQYGTPEWAVRVTNAFKILLSVTYAVGRWKKIDRPEDKLLSVSIGGRALESLEFQSPFDVPRPNSNNISRVVATLTHTCRFIILCLFSSVSFWRFFTKRFFFFFNQNLA